MRVWYQMKAHGRCSVVELFIASDFEPLVNNCYFGKKSTKSKVLLDNYSINIQNSR